MKCQNCNAFFVRLPCPECGWGPEITSSETEKIETLVKPSELKGDSAVNPSQKAEEKEETLVKPSSLLEKEVENKSGETLVKPSEYLKKQEVIVEEVEEEETLVKPSEYLKRREEEDQPVKEKEERLVKPSEVLGRVTSRKDVQVQEDERVEQLRRPSEMGGMTSGSISTKPAQLSREDNKITERSGETLLRPSQLKGTSGRGMALEDEPTQKEAMRIDKKSFESDNEEFKSEVKDTLQEVITLLEKLMEQ